MKQQGKRKLPYLLSTARTLARCGQYYYNYLDFKFNCRRNKEYHSETHCRTNVNRMWHNIIVPNAIIALKYGKPATIEDATEALNYAMTNAKTQTAIDAWKAVIATENAKPKEERLSATLAKSFWYYGRGMAANKDGCLYMLPKGKRVDLKAYVKRINKFKGATGGYWRCTDRALNTLIYAWIHYDDQWQEREEARDEREEKIKPWFDDRQKRLDELEAEREADPKPVFPATYEKIHAEFGSSYTTISKFKTWLKQAAKEDPDSFWDKNMLWAAFWREEYEQSIADKVAELMDDDDEVDVDAGIDSASESAKKSGDRPEGRWDESMPF